MIRQTANLGEADLTQSTDPATVIREIRTRLGLTQEKFAARLGVTLPTVNRWENSRTKPSPLAIQKLRDLISGMGDEAKHLVGRTYQD